MKYSIFEGNIERLERKLKRIQNKCHKYNASFKYEVVGEEFKKVEFEGEVSTSRFVIVEVEGFAKINDWEFVATIDHHKAGNVIRNIVDIEIPQRYWSSDPYCEHCNTSRRRKDTFLIHNVVTGEFKQVGRSCLRDFTGGYDAELVAAYIAMHDSLIESEEVNTDSPFFGSFNAYYSVEDIVKMSKAVITKLGFVSTSSESEYTQSSKSVLFDMINLLNNGINKFNRYLVDEGVTAVYEKFDDAEYLAGIKEFYINSDETSSYMNNLKVIFKSNFCKEKDFGYIVSAVYKYDKELEYRLQKAIAEKKKSEENALSDYVGNIKDRIQFDVASVSCVSCMDDGFGGLSYLYKFIDTDGNCLMWSTGKSLDHELVVKSIVGTVKDHKEYRGLKQTWVTRCKVTYGKLEMHHEPASNDVDEALQDFMDYVNRSGLGA